MPAKKGFWIKKTGLIKVDTSLTPKEKATFRKVEVDKPIQRLKTEGKSSKYLKGVIIPELKKRADHFRSIITVYERVIARLQASTDVLVKQIMQDYQNKLVVERKKIVKKNRLKIRIEVERRLKLRVVNMTKNNVAVYNGIVGHMITENFCFEHQISPRVLGLLTFISLHTTVHRNDLTLYNPNIKGNTLTKVINALFEKNYIQREKYSMFISLEGKVLIEKYKKAFEKQKRTINRTLDGKVPVKRRITNKTLGIGNQPSA